MDDYHKFKDSNEVHIEECWLNYLPNYLIIIGDTVSQNLLPFYMWLQQILVMVSLMGTKLPMATEPSKWNSL
jgi:hypothetical protein